MTTNRSIATRLLVVLVAAAFVGGVSVAGAENAWIYEKKGGVWGKGCYSAQHAQYQQYPCLLPVRKEHWGCTETHEIQDAGISPTRWVDGTLHKSAVKGETELVEKLLNAGANPNSINSYGYAPLHVAVSAGQTAIVEALLNAGADPDVVPAEASQSEHILKHCAGMTPLHFAAHVGQPEIVDALLAAGADANAADATGITPIVWSEKAGHVDATVSLLTGGATHQ